jgi:predicted secreted protein
MKMVCGITFFIFFSLVGCSEPTSSGLRLDSTINGKTVSYPINQKFILQLDLYADTGYQWKYAINDTNIVRIDSTSYAPKSGNWNQTGGTTVETFFFRTINAGQSIVTLIQHQPWLHNARPIDSLAFTVAVFH